MADHSGREENIVENEASIEILEDANNCLAAYIRQEMRPMPPSRCCIYKVPEEFRRVQADAYVPKIVSIGPFHYRKESLQAMEERKKWYLHAFMSRTSKSLEELVTVIRGLEEHARDCYAEPIYYQDSDEFVKMMLLDACLILEFLYIVTHEVQENENDHIFSTLGMLNSFVRDMMLLENQIPFFVLEHLFKLTRDPERGRSLDQIVMSFLNSVIIHRIGGIRNSSTIKGKHLLDMSRNQLCPTSQLVDICENYSVREYTNCATDLEKAGVRFKLRDVGNGLLDIRFSNGVLEIPHFRIDDNILDHLRNLVALDQCDKDATGAISSYVILLDLLVKSKEDVSLLRGNGIIENLMDDEETALAIHKLSIGVYARPFYYHWLCCELNMYCHKRWNYWRANLKRNYFNTPTRIFSFLAGVLALVLTFIGSLFAVLSYTQT